jgi:hypothetical protein
MKLRTGTEPVACCTNATPLVEHSVPVVRIFFQNNFIYRAAEIHIMSWSSNCDIVRLEHRIHTIR